MKILWGHKDGGPDSKVRVWGIEFKRGISILVLCFANGSREAFHTHAFNSISWVLRGGLEECRRVYKNYTSYHEFYTYFESWVIPIITKREHLHMVRGLLKENWVLSIRGPWLNRWVEIDCDKTRVLTHGRKVIHEYPVR